LKPNARAGHDATTAARALPAWAAVCFLLSGAGAARRRASRTRGAARADPLTAARASLASGDVAGPSAAARSLLSTASGASRLEPLLVLGVAEFGAAHEDAALAAFAEAQAVAPGDPRGYALESRVRLAHGDTDGARRALERGSAHAPGDSTLARGLRMLAGGRPPRPGVSP
jgi:hypothetical protein